MTITEEKYTIRGDFIDGLVDLSEGKISYEEANIIADRKFRLTDFSEGSPLGHKGPRWLAKNILRAMHVID